MTNAEKAYGRLPLSFEANQGQSDGRVKFLSRGSGYSLFLTGNEAVLALKKPEKKAAPGAHLESAALATRKSEHQSEAVLRMRLVGGNAAAPVTGLEELPGKSNYFSGRDPSKWRTNVPNYAKVKYADVYPGVDVVYYGNQRQLEFDLVVQPGGDPKAVRLDFRADVNGKPTTLRVDKKGELVVGTEGGEVIFHKPGVYQPAANDETRGSDKTKIDGKFVLAGAHEVRFQVGVYDRSRRLVIDPILAYSTFLGGSGNDDSGSIAVDASGNAYVTGFAGSIDFPTTPGAFDTKLRGGVFISKLNAAGSALLYSTFLVEASGGAGIAVDASGNAYVTGSTFLNNFPTTPGAFQTTRAGGPNSGDTDAFVTKLNPTGSALVYSTLLGGSGNEGASAIAVDASGNAYVTGSTRSTDFPTTHDAFQTTFRGRNSSSNNAFVSKLNAAGSGLVYSTYLGGVGDDLPQGIAVDGSGNAYVSGSTESNNFPVTPGAFQTNLRGFQNAFISRLNTVGSALVYSTYLGGSSPDSGARVAVDGAGSAYVTGFTESSNFPTTAGAFQTIFGGGSGDAFVSKLNAAGSALLYSTYLGGSDEDSGNGIAVDGSGNAYVIGSTSSPNFPYTPDTLDPGGVFISKLNADGSALISSSGVGGCCGLGLGIALDSSGNAYISGFATTADFPTTPGAFQTKFGGNGDAFVSKLTFGPPTQGETADLFLRAEASPTPVVQGQLLTLAFPVWNLGPGDAVHEVLNTQVPAGTTLDYIRVSGTPGLATCTQPKFGSTSGQIVCQENSSMKPNATWTVRLVVIVTAPTGTVITASGVATENTFDPNHANNSAKVSVTVH